MLLTAPTPESVLDEICFDRYISRPEEAQRVKDACLEVLKSQQTPNDRAKHVDSALRFSRILWEKYDCKEISDLYDKFQCIEEALFGLERDEAAGFRYRDHLVHMFNCYVFGLRIISELLSELNDAEACQIFRVQDEQLQDQGLPFGANYTHRMRLFYLWMLIATFHDIAIPFQHLKGIGSGINRFVQEFGWEFTDPQVDIRAYDASQLDYFFRLLAGLYAGGLESEEDGLRYRKLDGRNHYLARILGREFDNSNHGVLSGFFMWKTIEEIFLVDRSSKYRLNMDEFNTYAELVLEQDIARAALAICLHNLKPDPRNQAVPKVMPVRFSEFPLTFLLLLADELQEYLRLDGRTVEGLMCFTCHPHIAVSLHREDLTITPRLEVAYSWKESEFESAVSYAEALERHRGTATEVNDVGDAAKIIGESIKNGVESKLRFGTDFRVKLRILDDWERELYATGVGDDTATD